MSRLPVVTLYGKPGCHLCEDAEAILCMVAQTQPLDVRKVDIQASPTLLEQFQFRIPVIEVRDGDTLEWPTTLERVRKAVLTAANAGT